MYNKAKTGETPAMTGSHLLNSIKLFCEKFNESNISLPEYAKSFYPNSEDLVEKVEASRKKITEDLMPYIFWAMLRPSIKDEVISLLWETYDIVDDKPLSF